MSPKHRMITTLWCCITMALTMVLSHGHLIMKEVMTHWPTGNTWESRLESAMYTQGGLVFAASFVIGGVITLRGYLSRLQDQEAARREIAQSERHERATANRHDALMDRLASLAVKEPETGSAPKKHMTSGARPR